MRTVSNLVLKLVGTRFVRVAGHVIDRDECSRESPADRTRVELRSGNLRTVTTAWASTARHSTQVLPRDHGRLVCKGWGVGGAYDPASTPPVIRGKSWSGPHELH